MTINKEVEFNNIVSDILKNDKFISLKYEIHHGISRLDHCLHVARMTFFMCKKLHIKDYEAVTRAALLHDFYNTNEIKKSAFITHPKIAAVNACKEFELNAKQKNIIASHMFPVCAELPKYKESYIVSTADKLVALYECTKYKVPLKVGASMLFLINFLSIQR